MMFPSFGCNTVYTFRTLKPLERVFRQNPVEGGRPTWPNDRHKNLLFVAGNCWNYELWCFKKRKYHVLKLCQTRFCIFYIFFDRNWENWFRGIEIQNGIFDVGRLSAGRRPAALLREKWNKAAGRRPAASKKSVVFAKPIFSVFIN